MKRPKRAQSQPDGFHGSIDDQLTFLERLEKTKPSTIMEQSPGFLLASTMTRIRIVMLRKIKEYGYEITPEQGHVLNTIGESEGISQSEIADRTMKDKPTITRILDILERKKLINRKSDTGDRRAYKIFLTAAGREKIDLFRKIIEEVDMKAFGGLAEKDIKKFEEILRAIKAHVD
jgi:MarR family transcriptional regulator, transcriptional regulator for hemolysin